MGSSEARVAYDLSMEAFRASYHTYQGVLACYRAGTIDDATYLAAREKHTLADLASTKAEAVLIASEE